MKPKFKVVLAFTTTMTVLLAGLSVADDQRFSVIQEVAVGGEPTTIAVADFNHDGILDFATCNVNSDNVSVVIGLGQREFENSVEYDVGSSPFQIEAGDFNGDNNIDLIVENINSSEDLSLLIGNGDGSFQESVAIPIDGNTTKLAVGDFSGDGIDDVAVVLPFNSDERLMVLLGSATGQFNFLEPMQLTQGRFRISPGDVDGDSILDLILSGNTPGITILRGVGDGTFVLFSELEVGETIESRTEIGDVNSDGVVDLVSSANGQFFIFPGLGNGSFGPSQSFGTDLFTSEFRLDDIDNDEILDLLFVGSSELGILRGSGDGNFSLTGSLVAGTQSPRDLEVVDLDNDGFFDIVIPADVVRISWGTKSGFPGFELLPICGDGQDVRIASGDLNADGIVDVAITTSATDKLSLYFGDDNGSFSEPTILQSLANFANDIVIEDFNSDGIDDIAVAHRFFGVVVFLNAGDGNFGDAVQVTFDGVFTLEADDFDSDGIVDLVTDGSIFTGNGDGTFTGIGDFFGFANAIATGDFNSDGAPDVITSSNNDGFDLLLNDNAGGFFAGQAVEVGERPNAIASADFNNDGFADVAVSHEVGIPMSILLGSADGSLQPTAENPDVTNVLSLQVCDFNLDNVPDLIAVSEINFTPVITLLIGQGDGSFSTQQVQAGFGVFASCADVNSDGTQDLVFANGFPGVPSGNVIVLHSRSDGGFDVGAALDSGLQTEFVALADFNSDGILDIAASNRGSGDISIFVGSGNGVFANAQNYIVGGDPTSIEIGDFNGDQVLDLVVAHNRESVGLSDEFVSLLFGVGDGTFLEVERLTRDQDVGSIQSADLNSDGNLDLCITVPAEDIVSIYLGSGDGTFLEPINYRIPGDSFPEGLALGDFDGDGIQDIATANVFADTVFNMKGRSDGSFAGLIVVESDESGEEIVAEDFNGDGHLDLASGATILLGNGDTTFVESQQLEASEGLASVDLNNDGIPDLVGSTFGRLRSFTGIGDGTFVQQPDVLSEGVSDSFVVADFNQDTLNDFMVASSDGFRNFAIVVLNQGGEICRYPDSLNVFRGSTICGELFDAFANDGSFLKFAPGFTLNSKEAPVWIVFDGQVGDVSTLSLDVVTQSGTPGLTRTTEAFNFTTLTYDVLDERSELFNIDNRVTLDLTSGIGGYLSADGEVRARIGWRQTGFTLNFPWEARIDQLIWQTQ